MATTNTHLDHETRLNQILTASRELIAPGGVGALTIRAIARKVGVTEAAIYRHVDSKDHVLVLLLEDVRQSVLGTIEEATAPHVSAIDKLEHVLQHHLSFIESRRGISFVVIAEAAQFQEQSVRNAGRKLVEDYLKVVEGFIREGIESGKVNPAINPSAAATIFFGMVQASVTRWLFDSSAHPLTENVLSLWKLYRASLMAPGSVESASKSQ
ncbi:MAG: TetR/AcrR family transcriptional regulator [Chloroflexi bacterium]|nr:TetR/AcrR family transcriptional regulator [Chloroflexota bacterium]